MIPVSLERVCSTLFILLAVGAITNCTDNGPDIDFTANGDDQVMSVVTGVWSGTSSEGKTYTLTLCENDDAIVPDAEGCQELHTVQGGGRGKTETVNEPQGCGGCTYGENAFTSGTIEGDDLGATTIDVAFSENHGDANGLVFPMNLTTDGSATFYGGALVSAQEMDVTDFYYPISAASDDAGAATDVDSGAPSSGHATHVVLHRIADGQCASP